MPAKRRPSSRAAWRKAEQRRVELLGLMTLEEQIRWLVVDVVRLQNQQREALEVIARLSRLVAKRARNRGHE